MESHRDVVVFLYRALHSCIRKRNLQHAWAAVAIENLKRLCGEQALQDIHRLESREGASQLLSHVFRSYQHLTPEDREVQEAVDGGFEALRISEVLSDAKQRRELTRDRQGIRYSVGAKVEHLRFGYCGIIYGWDRICTQPVEWMVRMKVFDLPSGANQPFYYVLPDARGASVTESRYVAQDNIRQALPPRMAYRGVGRFFRSYDESLQRHIPVPYLRYLFPDKYDGNESATYEDDSD